MRCCTVPEIVRVWLLVDLMELLNFWSLNGLSYLIRTKLKWTGYDLLNIPWTTERILGKPRIKDNIRRYQILKYMYTLMYTNINGSIAYMVNWFIEQLVHNLTLPWLVFQDPAYPPHLTMQTTGWSLGWDSNGAFHTIHFNLFHKSPLNLAYKPTLLIVI